MSSVAVAETPDKAHDDSSKLKTFLSILRKFVGVADIASVRFSLPAHLLEPTPNLEYWNYLDRPETFASIGKSDEPLGRILEVLRFWFTKDLKYIKGKPCKPYNSTLGEFFRCSWDVKDNTPDVPLPATAGVQTKTCTGDGENSGPVKICYLTEQTSHHPPVSAFFIECPELGISARGFDQLSAKFTGTSIRVSPGQHNLGIFINLEKRDNEEYQLTHPCAHLGGLLRGALAISVSDTCYITCSKTRIKVILQYLEDGWLGRAQNKVEGVIFRYDPDQDTTTKIKDVPESDILAKISGSWHGQIYFTMTGTTEPRLLIDVAPLFPTPKDLPPEAEQLSNESLKFWAGVTNAIKDKRYGEATKLKQEIEERQREKAAERQQKNELWQPRFFTGSVTPLGKPELTEEGYRALQGLRRGDYKLEESQRKGA
ncbi:putative oxysterol binding protein (Orp8) [Aspergillus clavatus NRRL 1]|uniref:Oxysterol-binding protein, putative n=1 Tax=Aspergillus clavatus (strain ATCC 1007 / CBS 513.65 / DSM 816 / NCTC 3887 / NRRL 1 / QM 1276 / 107) TaxID=344612 RepID=A1CJ26_ASPCL|nr:oxysterol-binding protein, putative [Aspergillus clavatus NRRL 1]EAW09150.1 oxysterol-binding protein, putative [Aspergillus clavatus NRRL 1]